ncbi:MAG: beta-lactamase family protein [Saprospiraceae bacterium]|nr:beta-lactamase family protein [Saprospiraceae bacterium]
MKYLQVFLFLTICSWSAAQDYPLKKIDALLNEVDSAGPGVIIGVVKDQRLLHSVSRGMANLDYNIPIGTTSNFRLSSTSKQFTAACILHLADKEQLSLEDPLAKFFPEFSPQLGQVTIQQLLNHTSGIRDYMTLMMIQGSRQMDFFNNFIGEDQDIMKLMAQQEELSFESGSMHSYSNTNYWLLGQVVKRITDQSLEAYAQEHIFGPLGMNGTCFAETSGRVIPQRVAGYVSPCPDCERMEYRSQSEVVGDDGVISSIQDLLRWEQEFYQHHVLSDQCWDKMLTKGKLNNGEEVSYASGLIMSDFNGERLVKHSGQNPGFSSEILRFPDHQLSIIVLGNQNWYDVRRYANSVAEIFFPTPPSKPLVPNAPRPIAAHLTSMELEQFYGDYHFLETNEYRTVKKIGTELLYHRNNGPSSKLIPISKTTLIFEDRPHIQLSFSFEKDGTKHIQWDDPTMGKLHASSYEKAQLEDSKKMTYAAKYRSTELNTTIEIGLIENKLVLHILSQQIPLESTVSDEFVAMGMFTLKFERDQGGRILGFRMDAPRAENILFEKT